MLGGCLGGRVVCWRVEAVRIRSGFWDVAVVSAAGGLCCWWCGAVAGTLLCGAGFWFADGGVLGGCLGGRVVCWRVEVVRIRLLLWDVAVVSVRSGGSQDLCIDRVASVAGGLQLSRVREGLGYPPSGVIHAVTQFLGFLLQCA
ncbi:MAG: hypothetical protein ACRDNF_19215 [Streptosporangiaceae bacterium]